jgi:cysteine desulfurase / selenocysteine lyase
MTYLDNAATSFPKPEETLQHLSHFVSSVGGNPGRSGHLLSIEAARIIFQAREKLTAFINGEHSERLIFTHNGTESLNLAILGLVQEHDHIITTSMEHNSVMRPLDFLQKEKKVEVSIVPCSASGELDLAMLRTCLKKNTRVVILNHGSNVIGTVQSIKQVREAIGETTLIVDACQTIGNTPIDIRVEGVDIICFSCHKSLFGIQGLGALYMRKGMNLRPLKFGGTGSKSESTRQPEMLPDKYESGTPNTPGIAALLGGLTFIEKTGLAAIIEKKKTIRNYTLSMLSEIDDLIVYGHPSGESLPIISINIKGVSPSDVGTACNRANICVRVGLHCAPVAHRTIGSFPQGTVRISPGYFTRKEEIDRLAEVLNALVRKR